MPAPRPVLLCHDGSEPSARAIAAAGELLGGGPAVVLHVWRPLSTIALWNPLLGHPTSGPLKEAADELDEAGAERARQVAGEGARLARDAGFDAQPRTVSSDRKEWREIVRAAERCDARVVVLGSRGQDGAGAPLLGGVANAVVHHCRRPVLVIPSAPGG
jgi:nucleotide-binding universal stress UspA family protein